MGRIIVRPVASGVHIVNEPANSAAQKRKSYRFAPQLALARNRRADRAGCLITGRGGGPGATVRGDATSPSGDSRNEPDSPWLSGCEDMPGIRSANLVLSATCAPESGNPQRCRNSQGTVCMHTVAVDLGLDLLGHFHDLSRGTTIASTQRRQTQWLMGLAYPKVEPPAKVSGKRVHRPAVKGKLDDLFLDVDKADVCKALLGKVAVHAQWAAKSIHDIEELVRPFHNQGVPRKGTVVAAGIPVDLDLLDMSVMGLEMPAKGVKRCPFWGVPRTTRVYSPENLRV